MRNFCAFCFIKMHQYIYIQRPPLFRALIIIFIIRGVFLRNYTLKNRFFLCYFGMSQSDTSSGQAST